MADVEAAPERIGPYSILERLGRGGMGVVYRARHHETGRLVALKTVRVPRSELLTGIRREIHALARLSHPGIVRILDEGVQDGVPWYAMELVEGITLRRALSGSQAVKASGPKRPREPWWTRTLEDTTEPWTQSPAQKGARRAASGEPATERPDSSKPAARGSRLHEVLSLVRRLCGPLAFLHGEGIVHRDLKPDNILLRNFEFSVSNSELERNSAQRAEIQNSKLKIQNPVWPVLVDFGLAARFGGEISRDALEVDGWSGGTLAFMAPEQLRGELVDARADLYALGCILYWALTGQVPFHTLQELEAPGIEARRPSELASRIAPELDALVLGLLRKRPRERLGYADAVAAALEALGATEGPGTPVPPARAYLYRAELAGRGELADALGRHVAEGLQAGHGGLVLMGGESGIGKTRLALELAQRVRRRGFRVLAGECLPRGGPLHPLRGLFEHVADRCRERGVEETRRLLGPAGKVLALYEPVLGKLPGLEQCPEPAELAPQEARARLYDALSGLLASLTAQQPALLLLDDLQWADDLTLGFLELMLRSGRFETTALVGVGTYRTEEVGEALQRLLDEPRGRGVRLQRLDEAAIRSIVGDMLALSPPPALLARFLTRRSGGNPFFAAEYLRVAVEERLIYRDGRGRWQVAETREAAAVESTYEALALPAALGDLVGRRLRGLSPEGQVLAEICAVLGRELSDTLLADIASRTEQQFWDARQELLTRQVLEDPETGKLRFAHDQIREAAYERIDSGRRRELHRLAAQAIESGNAGSVGEQAALGHHWEQALERGKASEAYLAAARASRDRHDHGEADRLYRACLRLVDRPSRDSVEAYNELGTTLRVRGRNRDAAEQHRNAHEHASRLEDAVLVATSLLALAMAEENTGRRAEARAHMEEALETARRIGDRGLEGRVLATIAGLDADEGLRDEARERFERALPLLREAGDRRMEATSACNLAHLDLDEGHGERARELYERARAIFEDLGDRTGLGKVLGYLATLLITSDPAAACGAFEEALEVQRQVGDQRAEGANLVNLSQAYEAVGRLREAREVLQQALAIHRAAGDPRLQALTLVYGMRVERRSGDLARAESLRDELAAMPIGDRDIIRAFFCVERGHLDLAAGRDARACLEELEPLAAGLNAGPDSPLGKMVAALQGAIEAAEAGARQRLCFGELLRQTPEGPDVPEQGTGQTPAAAQAG